MLDLTPVEVVRLVQILKALPENVMIINENDELTLLEKDEHTATLVKKIKAEGDREDVKAYLEKNYGGN